MLGCEQDLVLIWFATLNQTIMRYAGSSWSSNRSLPQIAACPAQSRRACSLCPGGGGFYIVPHQALWMNTSNWILFDPLNLGGLAASQLYARGLGENFGN